MCEDICIIKYRVFFLAHMFSLLFHSFQVPFVPGRVALFGKHTFCKLCYKFASDNFFLSYTGTLQGRIRSMAPEAFFHHPQN